MIGTPAASKQADAVHDLEDRVKKGAELILAIEQVAT